MISIEGSPHPYITVTAILGFKAKWQRMMQNMKGHLKWPMTHDPSYEPRSWEIYTNEQLSPSRRSVGDSLVTMPCYTSSVVTHVSSIQDLCCLLKQTCNKIMLTYAKCHQRRTQISAGAGRRGWWTPLISVVTAVGVRCGHRIAASAYSDSTHTWFPTLSVSASYSQWCIDR